MKDFLLKTKFISALMIVVNLHFFNSIHCCFVYLCFYQVVIYFVSCNLFLFCFDCFKCYCFCL